METEVTVVVTIHPARHDFFLGGQESSGHYQNYSGSSCASTNTFKN